MPLHLWLTDKKKTTEGHTMKCSLYFRGAIVWGPESCHSNTSELARAIHEGDNRFELQLEPKDGKTVEGHTCAISVEAGGRNLLDKLSTHRNMQGMIDIIHALSKA